MQEPPSQAVSELLLRWKTGDKAALAKLVPLVYEELRGVARRQLRRERAEHTLQSAALVNEAYLRLVDQRPFDADNRAHFVAVAARLMRQILVDYARGHGAAKRGADQRVELDVSLVLQRAPSVDVVALDDALQDLERLDQQQGQIVELRFFGGLSIEEVGEVLKVSPSTVKRDWNVAKAWLHRQMKSESRGNTGALAEN